VPTHVGQCEQARDQVLVGLPGGRDQGAVRVGDPDPLRLAAVEPADVLAVGVHVLAAHRAGVVAVQEAADDEVARLHRGDRVADLLDDPYVPPPAAAAGSAAPRPRCGIPGPGLTGAVMIGAMLYLTFHLQIVLDLTPLHAGLASLPITGGIMVTVPFATKLLNQIGPRRQLVFGPLISAVGVGYLSFITVDVPLQNLSLLGVAPHDAGAAAATARPSEPAVVHMG
jgi:hypothetical protein